MLNMKPPLFTDILNIICGNEKLRTTCLPPTANSKINYATAISCIRNHAVNNPPIISGTYLHSNMSRRKFQTSVNMTQPQGVASPELTLPTRK